MVGINGLFHLLHKWDFLGVITHLPTPHQKSPRLAPAFRGGDSDWTTRWWGSEICRGEADGFWEGGCGLNVGFKNMTFEIWLSCKSYHEFELLFQMWFFLWLLSTYCKSVLFFFCWGVGWARTQITPCFFGGRFIPLNWEIGGRCELRITAPSNRTIGNCLSRWWFQIFLVFTPNLGEDSHVD